MHKVLKANHLREAVNEPRAFRGETLYIDMHGGNSVRPRHGSCRCRRVPRNDGTIKTRNHRGYAITGQRTVPGLRPVERLQLPDNPSGVRVRDGREFGVKMAWSDHGDGVGVSRAVVADREMRVDSLVLTRCHNRP